MRPSRYRHRLNKGISEWYPSVSRVRHTNWSRIVRRCGKETTGGFPELGLHPRRHSVMGIDKARTWEFLMYSLKISALATFVALFSHTSNLPELYDKMTPQRN